jgi:hypothetical protein
MKLILKHRIILLEKNEKRAEKVLTKRDRTDILVKLLKKERPERAMFIEK